MEVMVEGANPARGQINGRSSQNKPVNFTTSLPIAPAPGSYMKVRITTRIQTVLLEKLSKDNTGGDAMDVEVRIRGLMMDPATNMPIVVLKDVGSDTVMPIWVGTFEANAIAIEIEKVAPSRPMTHDLTRNLMRHMNAQLERIVINELRDDTFFAVLWLRQDGELVTMGRSSVGRHRAGASGGLSIFVSEQVLQSAKLNMSGPPDGPTAEELRGWLEGLNDEDLGRYKM